MRRRTAVRVLLALAVVVGSSCQNGSGKSASVSAPAWAVDRSEAALRAWNAGDFDGYVALFIPQFKASVTKAQFDSVRTRVIAEAGECSLGDVSGMTKDAGAMTVAFEPECPRDESIELRVTFDDSSDTGPHLIRNFQFTSPKLTGG